MNSDIIKKRDSIKDSPNTIEALIIVGVISAFFISIMSIAWILLVTAIVVTQRVLS